ncbi:hypothetical protein A3I27_04620 [Candidatus Giovannonibacteria bacterium RIFCSPLOWO2_02_FULL_43_11b]|uniref:Uncharacterized protein n=1 Tax=Candidatus Giovannonibacteria bacterium RIFCSPHIGHO2_12_FULL_43_15 TaxID=1798341 RepID=A0A1F5WRF2_9BACT|nr:MAG: hypothetical protein A2739_02360 [Candidatus Giovannonibacteria bacterium RIFCSPHIGHO2_01_FULL_43_100]OGF67249.1 MAG: hypothetical protein A3B97_00355 [Candidatus Giovannonibacteria bacterium RIFCSPHIGHO2_02_FULL_43_32]OGF78242.1 MAG: hypothetical protein A3F23_02315 [Candidatus Giovannonibacteria bacterium RIFCSPHIGHO2_12_FULL_43_15]OGF90311.1 MAG: hypothetical protein A3I27_04620 [Candidatus Giovannonibacteria bacterium RIFCSPLOWO2_02_FULL_43_11b]OGF92169.1 MAG: hypothetical protein A
MALKLDDKKIKLLIKEGVKEAMDAQMIKLGAFLIPYVSEAEQKNIVKLYKWPSRKASRSYQVEL